MELGSDNIGHSLPNYDWGRTMVSLDPCHEFLEMLRHKLSQFADWKPPQYWRFAHLWKEFCFRHCLHNAEEGTLILSLFAPSDARWGSDLYLTNKLSAPGHFLTHQTWTSWICSALNDCFFAGFHQIWVTTVWTSRLLVLMQHGRPCCRWSTVPISMSCLMVRYANILLIFSSIGAVKISEANLPFL